MRVIGRCGIESTESKEISRKVQRKMSVDKVALFAKGCIFATKKAAYILERLEPRQQKYLKSLHLMVGRP